MVRPPSHAPAALPTLKAAMLAPLARVGAEPAYVMIRICRPGTVANPKAPISTRLTTEATGEEAVRANMPMTTASAASTTVSVTGRDRLRRHQRGHAHEGDDADHGDRPERRAPAELLAEQGAERDTEDVRGGEAGEHHGDRARLLLRRDQPGGHDGTDAEERAVRQGREDAPEQHDLVAAGESRDEVAGDEQHHQRGQHVLAVEAGDGSGQADGADRDRERVAGDEPAGGGLVDGEVGGHLREEAGDHELGESDAEATEGQGEQGDGHERVPSLGVVVQLPFLRRYAACATTGVSTKLVAHAGYCKSAVRWTHGNRR